MLDGRTLVVHATDWNRLDVSDPATGERLTLRDLPQPESGQPRPNRYMDYCHAGLSVSPDYEWIADWGWIWHPVET